MLNNYTILSYNKMVTVWTVIFTIIKVLAYLVILLLLLYIIIEVRFIVNNLPIACSGKQDFDPTKKYEASFVFPGIIAKSSKTKSIDGIITGTKTNATTGTFSISFTSNPLDGSKPNTTMFPDQKYTYEKSTCKLTYVLTTGSQGVQQYLDKYHIDLSPYVADLLPNAGLRLSGSYTGLGVSIPLAVTAYPS
jgi:hypothetical protein